MLCWPGHEGDPRQGESGAGQRTAEEEARALNYRHAFHAGNFADVFKHLLLILLIRALNRKDTPWLYYETHAGTGRYDLASSPGRRSPEWRQGIGLLWEPESGIVAHPLELDTSDTNAAGEVRVAVERYLAMLMRENARAHASRRFYPGSPRIAMTLARERDRLVFCELERRQAAVLARNLGRDRRVVVLPEDGYFSWHRYLPAREHRGLALIDPPYERADEYARVAGNVHEMLRRWPQGIVAVWYPIKDRRETDVFLRRLLEGPAAPCLVAEIAVRPEDVPLGINGCGLAVFNAPYRFDAECRALLPGLALRLRQTGAGRWSVSGAGSSGATSPGH